MAFMANLLYSLIVKKHFHRRSPNPKPQTPNAKHPTPKPQTPNAKLLTLLTISKPPFPTHRQKW